MPHPNDMTAWADIVCQRGHGPDQHHSVERMIRLADRHGYHDLPQFPPGMNISFRMRIWDTALHPVDGGPYCPCHDAVSETIVSHGTWEPRESILTLHAMLTARAGIMVDFGCQIGWFSLLGAAANTVPVLAIDAEWENLRLLGESLRANDWTDRVLTERMRVGPMMQPLPLDRYRLVKIDLEGAEVDAVDMIRASLDMGLVDFLLIEVSPVFKPGAHYGDLLGRLCEEWDFDAFLLPPKQRPPVDMTDPARALASFRIEERGNSLRARVASWHQEDVWLARRGVEW